MIPKRFAAIAVSALLAAFALLGQNFDSDEIKSISRPYIPLTGPAIRTQTNLVEIRVTVRDAKGNPVSGLTQADFQLFDNGKPQEISGFSVEASEVRASKVASGPAPSVTAGIAAPAQTTTKPPIRYVAIFFDDTNMRMGDLAPARAAVQKFISGGLQPGNMYGIFTASPDVTLEFTDDQQKLLDSLTRIRPRVRMGQSVSSFCPRLNLYQSYRITEQSDTQALDLAWEEGVARNCWCQCVPAVPGCICTKPQDYSLIKGRARQILSMTENNSKSSLIILESIVEYLAALPGRRTLLLASSGFFASSFELQRLQHMLIEFALRHDVVINSLDAKGVAASISGGDPSEGDPLVIARRPDLMTYSDQLLNEQREMLSDPLSQLALGTGGRFFHNSNDLEQGVRDLASAPEISYVLSFSPVKLKLDQSYHNLKVKLARPGHFTLDARRGYFASENTNSPQFFTRSEKFDAAVLASYELARIPVEIRTSSALLGGDERALYVVFHVNTANLSFERRGERNLQRLRFAAVLFDQKGKIQAGTEAVVDLALKEDTRASFARDGMEHLVALRASAGSYRLRVAVQEMVQSRIAASSRPVEIQ